MHISSFFLPVVLFSVVNALPVPQSVDLTATADSFSSGLLTAVDSTDSAVSVTASSLATDAVSASLITSAVPASLVSDASSASLIANATATGLSLVTDSASPSSTDTSVLPTITDSSSLNATTTDTGSESDSDASTISTDYSSSVALSTDASFPTATDTSDPDGSGATLTSATAAPTALSFTIPVVPSACAALPSGLPVSIPILNSSATFSAVSAASTDNTDSSLLSSFIFTTTLTAVPFSITAAASSVISSALNASASAFASVDLNATSAAAISIPLVSATVTDSASLPVATNATDVSGTNVDIASPIIRRIAQADLPAVAQSWQDLCLVSGGDIFTNEPCVTLAGINGINALLASADPCDQQDNADAMIDFANSPGVTNTDALIANAVAFRAHPRNALNINGVVPSTPYCQRAPRNPQLASVVNAQLDGVDPGIFGGPSVGLVAFGDPSSCPFGTAPDVTTCSCS